MSADGLFERAVDERGPFGDHLRHHLFRLHGNKTLEESLRGLLRGRECKDVDVLWRLTGAGLVHRVGDGVVPRCPLYAEFFRRHLA
jgi:hypothetical protein